MPKLPPEQVLPQPHDALFKYAFSQRRHAIGLLKATLPKAAIRAVDFRSLRVEKGSFVDQALRHRHSDLVISVRVRGQQVYFYVLVEQQRDVEPLMIVRIGIYMMRLWDRLLRDQPKMTAIPPIFPLLIHHSDTGWTAATAFQEVVAAEGVLRQALLPYIPQFEVRLVDLSEGKARHLAERALTALGKIVLWCLSVARNDARLEVELGGYKAAWREVAREPDGLAALAAVVQYLGATHGRETAEKVVKVMEKDSDRTLEGHLTWAAELELKGAREGRAKMLLQLLAARFGDVSAEVVAKVKAADGDALDRWAVRVLTAPTLEEVLDGGEDTAQPARSSRRPAARTRAQRARGTRRAS